MKALFYILILVFVAAIVISVYNLDFEHPLWTEINNYQWLTIAASVCGLLLSAIFLRYQTLKENLEKN